MNQAQEKTGMQGDLRNHKTKIQTHWDSSSISYSICLLVSFFLLSHCTWFVATQQKTQLLLFEENAGHCCSGAPGYPLLFLTHHCSLSPGTSWSGSLTLPVAFKDTVSWCSGKESACQCRRHRFNPWVGKIPWRRAWQPTLVFLIGKSPGQRSLLGYSPWGHKRVGRELSTKQQQQMS